MRDIIVITGPTATGKTNLAFSMAKKYHGSIINADSRQMYTYLDIITGKDIPKFSPFTKVKFIKPYTIGYYTVDNINLWLYDVVPPSIELSAYIYSKLVHETLNYINKNTIPIIVGGSYLYIQTLLYGIDTQGIKPNIRERTILETKTVDELQNLLKKLDIQTFLHLNNSDVNNKRRLIRKIQLAKYKDRIIHKQRKPQYNIIKFIGLKPKNHQKLIKNIKLRINARIKSKALDEVTNLINKGFTMQDPGMNTIAISEILDYLGGKIDLTELKKIWTIRETRYAKRQYVFMKKDPNITWIEV